MALCFIVVLALLLMAAAEQQQQQAAAVTFGALTNVGDFWSGNLTINGVIEICPRSPPNLLPFTEDTLLCTANGTMMLTTDGGKSWHHQDASEVMRPFLPPPKWMQRIGAAGKPTTAVASWVGINPVSVYLCDYPKKGPCDRTTNPPSPIVGAANHSYCSWGLDDTTKLPVVFCGEREASVAVQTWSGLPITASEFCIGCGNGVQLADGSFLWIMVVQMSPDWEPADVCLQNSSSPKCKAIPCCNNSVVSYKSQDGLNWHYSATVGSSELLDPTTGEKYGEGPNECALVVLKDKKTVWAVMRVDGGDGYFTKPFISALSSDGGVT